MITGKETVKNGFYSQEAFPAILINYTGQIFDL